MTAVLSRRRFRPQLERLEDRSVPTATATATALTSSLNPAVVGQPVTFTATVTGGDFPAGTILNGYRLGLGTNDVTFFDGATPLGTVKPTPTGGANHESRALFTSSALGVGTHVITAHDNRSILVNNIDGIIAVNEGSTSNAVNEVINPSIALDAPAAVSVTRVSLPGLRNPAVQLITLRNTGGATVEGPLYLILHGLRRGVRLKGASGLAQQHGRPGDPFLALNVTLLPGGELTLGLLFSNPTRRSIRFTAQVLAGPGAV